jgi:hypothetical protein
MTAKPNQEGRFVSDILLPFLFDGTFLTAVACAILKSCA